MEQVKCLTCGRVNPADEPLCLECGSALAAPNAAVVEEPAAIVPPADTVVVRREGMSQSAVLATFLLGLVALVVVGILMYQWGRTKAEEDDLARERAERIDRADRARTESRPVTPAAPVTTTPVYVPPSAPPVTVPTLPAVPTDVRTGSTAEPRPDPCAQYVTLVEPILEDWNELLTAAETQTGDELARMLGRLQDVQRQASRVEAPACAGAVHGRLLTAMTATIDALRTGSPGGGFPTSSEAYQQARELFEKFQTDYDALRVTHS